MKKLALIAVTLILSLTNVAAQETSFKDSAGNPAKSCADVMVNPKVNFSTSYGKLTYDLSKNQRQLTQLGHEYGVVESGLFASGLAIVGVNWEVSVGTLSNYLSNNTICVVPTSIDVFIGYQDPTIFISNELKPGSCEYNLVVRHERTHQQINKTALDYFIPLFNKAIGKIVKSVKPIEVHYITEIDAATSKLTEKYTTKIEPLINVFKKELLLEQSKLDNHDNYEMESTVCRGKS